MRKMGRPIAFICFFLLIIPFASAQVSHGGKPRSFQKSTSLKAVYPEILPYQDNDSLLKQEEKLSEKEGGFKFGEEISVDFSLDNSGVWDTLADGSRLWRLGIYSANAYSLNLIFDTFHIPFGSNLFIYTADKSFIMGAFTEKNNNSWNNFATSLFPHDEIVLEYYEPEQNKGLGKINLTTVVHGYKDFFFKWGTLGSSASCNINVNCPEGDNFHLAKRAVGKMILGGNSCSGTLINNTRQDGTPYFLTARHCMTIDPSKLVFVFNYETSDCEGNTEKTSYSYNGSTLLASHIHSDFALLLLSDTLEVEAMPYFAGWDRRDIAITNAVCIHHPKGDIKKISLSIKLLESSKYYDYISSYPDDTHWEVPFWDKGTTEFGSSGSGLFNTFQQLIGQLEGGYALCIGSQPSDEGDWYGKFSYSWTNNDNSDSNRLDYWLDPLRTGVETLNGYDPHNVGMNRFDKEEYSITLSPNPANDVVRIDASVKMLFCSIYAINGQLIDELPINSSTTEIRTHAYPAGMYLLKIKTEQRLVHKKLIIQK